MKESELEKINKLMQRKTKGRDSSGIGSLGWMNFCGAAQGIEGVMAVLGYEWDGAEFVEVSHD